MISLANVPTFVEPHDVQIGRVIASGFLCCWRGSALRIPDYGTEGNNRVLFQIEHPWRVSAPYTALAG